MVEEIQLPVFHPDKTKAPPCPVCSTLMYVVQDEYGGIAGWYCINTQCVAHRLVINLERGKPAYLMPVDDTKFDPQTHLEGFK